MTSNFVVTNNQHKSRECVYQITLTKMSDQQLEFDDTDMGDLNARFNVPPPRPIESLENLIQRVGSTRKYPKENMRRLWVNIMSERDKALKQLQMCDQKLEHWVARRNYQVTVLQQIDARLQEIEPLIMSDVMTR